MLNTQYDVYVRSADLTTTAKLDFFESLLWNEKHQPVDNPGAFSLIISADAPAISDLLTPQAGIEIRRGADTVFSGEIRKQKRTRQVSANQYEFTGYSDTDLLNRRVVSPQPSTAAGGPYNSQEYDTRTDLCSTVMIEYVDMNLGPSSIATRRDPRVTLAPDPLVGTTVTGNGRWQKLSTLINELSLQGGNIGYRIRQNDQDLEFETYEPEDLSDIVKFSLENGTLLEYEYEASAGELNYVYVGGGGEGTARVIKEGQDGDAITRWGRTESFKDQRDTSVTADLNSSIAEELATGADTFIVEFEPSDIEDQQYFEHYQLGDIVTVNIEGQTFVEAIREVRCSLNQNGFRATPIISTPNNQNTLKMFDRLTKQNRRLSNLERR